MTDKEKLKHLSGVVREVVRLLETSEHGYPYLSSIVKGRLADALGKIDGTESPSLVFYYGNRSNVLFADTPFSVRKFKVKEVSYGKFAAYKKSGSKYEEIGIGDSLEEAEAVCLKHYSQIQNT